MPRVKKKKKTSRKAAQETPRLSFGARLALLVLSTIIVIVTLSWVWHSRWPHTVATKLIVSSIDATRTVGFAVSDVSLQGRHYTDRDDIFKALGVKAGSPIFTFDPEDAHQKIMALPWTAHVTVLRSLPNKIIIKLVERKPIARLKNGKKTIVIDSHGKELTAANPKQFSNLPLVIGDSKPKQIRILLALLQREPVVARSLKASVRISNRRWNFYLRPNLLVKMPERNLQKALTNLTLLIQERKVLERDIKSIDLRLSNRMVLEPREQETK